MMIINTNVKHELVGGGYAERRAQCELAAKILGIPALRDATAEDLEKAKGKLDEMVYRRARHVIGEIERTVRAAEGVRASNWTAVGQLMYASHDSLRDDYEVSCKELDVVVEIAEAIGIKGGIYGCRTRTRAALAAAPWHWSRPSWSKRFPNGSRPITKRKPKSRRPFS